MTTNTNHPDPNDPLYFVRLGEQQIRERDQRRAVAHYDPEDAEFTEANDFENVDPRHDGWTPVRQREFLTALARGFSVSRASDMVGMSRQSAYALRESARGAAFALGWDAALLRARDVLVDELMDRAFNGVRETVTHDDGRTITRRRHDNRLALQMLARLDKRADAARAETGTAAIRLAAADFEQYLDLIGRDAAPARAGLFIAARIERAGEAAAVQDDLAPVRALGRADRWLRTQTDSAQPIDTADLDPAKRASWTAEQWLRAEAVGLMQLAPEPAPEPAADETASNCQLRQPAGPVNLDNPDNEPVWWSEKGWCYRTSFPPPDDFDGEESGQYGYARYWRTLSTGEIAAILASEQAEIAAELPAAMAERDAWFADLHVEPATGATAAVAGAAAGAGAAPAAAPH